MALFETNKPQNFEAREELLLRCARHILRENDYRALTIDRLAREAGYSRMTVYKHFADADDVIMAICIQTTGRRADLAERAGLFRGCSRERMTAVLALVDAVEPYHVEFESVLYATKIFKKALPQRRSAFELNNQRLVLLATGIVREAIGAGDLELRVTQTPERIAISLLTLNRLTYMSSVRGLELGPEMTIESWEDRVRSNHPYMDFLGWRPLSRDMNYVASANRMWRGLFGDVLERFKPVMLPDSVWKEIFPDYDEKSEEALRAYSGAQPGQGAVREPAVETG